MKKTTSLSQRMVALRGHTGYDFGVLLKKFVRICSEELQKAKRTVVASYEAMREIDQRTLEMALTFFRIR